MRIASGLSALLVCLVAAPLLAQDPCAGRQGERRNMLFDYRQGVDLTHYNRVAGLHRQALVAGADEAARKNTAQRKAWANAFDKIDHLGLSYSQARIAYQEGYDRLRRDNDPSILQQEIRIYQETEIYDWDRCEYIYEVELAIPSVPSLGAFSAKLRNIIDSLDIVKEQKGKVEINLGSLINRLSADPRFVELVRELMENPRFEDDLRYRDDDTQRLLHALAGDNVEISNYQRGQYRVNAFIGTLIQQAVVPRVTALLGKHRQVKVTCWGYTDRLRVRLIAYRGFATFGPVNEILSYRFPEVGEDLRDYRIRSNSELSVARGFEGIQGLAIALGQQSKNPRLKLQYAGGGELDAGKRDHPESRKIRYVLEYGDR